MNLYLDLFFTFFRIGLFTFGGGYAMLAILEDTCVEGKHWITHEEMMDIVQVSHNTFYKYLKEIRKEDEERLRKENAKNPRMEELREFMDDTKA